MKEYPVPYKKDSIYFQYHVRNYEQAKRFYEDIMGFEKVWDAGAEVGWVEFELPVKGARLGLNVQEDEIKKGSGFLTINVDNIDKTREYFAGRNLSPSDIIDIPNMVSYFNIEDTDGNPIQFIAEPRIKSK